MHTPITSWEIQTLQGSSKPRPRFDLDSKEPISSSSAKDNSASLAASMFNSKEDKDEKRRPSYMPTRGIGGLLNQGLATLGEKLGNLFFSKNQKLLPFLAQLISFFFFAYYFHGLLVVLNALES